MKDPNFTIIVDTREQQPWTFDNYTTASKKLDTGDYSIDGLQHVLAIERKRALVNLLIISQKADSKMLQKD